MHALARMTYPLATALAVWVGASAAQGPQPVSLSGTLVDVVCFALERAAAARREPAPSCAPSAGDGPMGIVTGEAGDGTLFVLATPPGALAPHVGKTARIDGEKSPRGDIVKPQTLEVQTEDGWLRVQLLPDM